MSDERPRKITDVASRLARAERDVARLKRQLESLVSEERSYLPKGEPGATSIAGMALNALETANAPLRVTDVWRRIPPGTTEATIRMSLDRLVRVGRIVRVSKGVYATKETARA